MAVFVCVAAAALAFDQITKFLAQAFLDDGRTVRIVPGLLSLRLIRNPGASLGMGSGATWLIALFALVVSVAILWLGVRTVSMRWTVFLALAFAGAVGNLIDRVAYADGFLNGRVVDFLDYGWSIGNVADIVLMAAGIGVVVLIARGEPFSAKDLERRDATDADAHDADAAATDSDEAASTSGTGETSAR